MKNFNFGCRRSDFTVTSSNNNWFMQCSFYEEKIEKSFLLLMCGKP
ncbi:hypothetical protein [Chryseobacterium sp. JUb7]|nr:hypothetical protein [Chryseobacterium sp. JUb7]MCS3529090.1 hypothetical protein [Chryseobacterium sp. JUb7]